MSKFDKAKHAEYIKTETVAADKLWEELKLEEQDSNDITMALCDNWNIEGKMQHAATMVMKTLLGDRPSQASFRLFAFTFGPIGEGEIIHRIVAELFDPAKKDVACWWRGAASKEAIDEELKLEDCQVDKAFLLRMGSIDGTISIERQSKKKAGIMTAKSRLINVGDAGWYCQELKQNYKNLSAYFDARGKDGDGKMLHPIARHEQKKLPDGSVEPPAMYKTTF